MPARSASRTVDVPRPPRGRRQSFVGDLRRRVQVMRDAERRGTSAVALLGLVADVILLLKDLAVDPRVPRTEKVIAGIAAAYLVSPVDLIPDAVPVLGQADDAVVAVLAFRRLLNAAGYDLIYQLWRGSDQGLSLVLTLAGVQT